MFVSYYRLDDPQRIHARRHHVIEPSVVVGTAAGCGIVLTDPQVAPRHIRITLAQELLLEDLESGFPTLVDGQPARDTTVIRPNNEIQIGQTVIHVQAPRAPWVVVSSTASPLRRRPSESDAPLSSDPDELRFVDALRQQPDDEDTRLVYADWLEERGAYAKAAFVRADIGLDTHRAQLLHEAPDAWRAIMARATLACSHQPPSECPRRWERLTPTPDPHVRRCAVCMREVVHYVVVGHPEPIRNDLIAVLAIPPSGPRADDGNPPPPRVHEHEWPTDEDTGEW